MHISKQTTQAIMSINTYNKELIRRYHKEMKLRKKYHNELVELKGKLWFIIHKKYHNELVELKGKLWLIIRE